VLEISIVDAKVGKSSWISKINCHYSRGRGAGRDDGGGPIGCCRTAEVTNHKSGRADCVKYDFHYRRRSSTKCSQLSKELVIADPFRSAGSWLGNCNRFRRVRLLYPIPAQQGEILKRKNTEIMSQTSTSLVSVNEPHALSSEDVLNKLVSHRDGLTTAEATDRLKTVGANRLPAPPKEGLLKRFFKHFNDILIYILLFAGVAKAFLGHWVDRLRDSGRSGDQRDRGLPAGRQS
jgi:magnesium-transporting ATPase (P-type)